jgi:sterol O-acyltransferase
MPERPSLLDNAEYSTSGEIPQDSDIDKDSDPQLRLLEQGEDESIDTYELTSRVRVHRRYHEGKAKSNLDDIKFALQHSLLDELDSTESKFKGFYVMAWLAIGVINLDYVVNYIMDNGFHSDIVSTMMRDLVWVGLTDLMMYLSIYFVILVQWCIKKNWITWHGAGWMMTSIYELAFILYFMFLAEHLNFPWIGKIFLFLHSIVQLMKMHSYSFYNGYLWNISEELIHSEAALKKNSEVLPKKTRDELEASIEFCTREIKSQSDTMTFPQNINLSNFFIFSMYPTVVYQIDYPRTPKIRLSYLMKKLCAVFGVIILMVVVAQTGMYPIAVRAIALRELPLNERVMKYPMLLLDLMPSFFLMYILVFYLIWDAILNAIAELTKFGDRDFYGNWWNSKSWHDFSKLWNKPVHKFLLRHVYHSSLSALKLRKSQATLFTFFVSSIVHELAMYVIFHKLRGYLLCCQMFQLPLIYLQGLPSMRHKDTLNNAIFWIGIASGPSIMCTLYLTF